jgi:S1-C subfamily serine protease
VQAVVPGGPADKSGLKAGTGRQTFQETDWRVGGDIVTRAGDRAIRKDTDLGEALLVYDPGQTITLDVVRDGKPRQVQVRLGTRPLQSPRG